MKKFSNQQIMLLILTLIFGAAYFLFGGSSNNFNSGILTPRAVNLPNNPPQDVQPATEPVSSNIEQINETELKTAEKKTQLIISKWQTSNNIPVFFVRAAELPMIDIALTFKAGSVYAAEKPGVASLTSTMLSEGTKNHNTDQISEIFENLGANFNSSANLESASVSLRSLTEADKLNNALSLFTDILSNSNFPSKSFERVKKNAIEELKLEDQYPQNVISKKFYQEIYTNNPYGIPADGSIESVSTISPKDLKEFYKKYYVSNNAIIAMVGNVDEAQAKQIAEQIATAIPAGSAAPVIQTVDRLPKPIKQHISFPSTQTHILVGGIGIKRSDPDYFPLTVGNHVLGTLPLVSLLFKNIRIERGLAYSVSSRFVAMQNPGPFLINMQTRNEKVSEALDVTLATLKNYIANGPSEEELKLAKENLIGGFALGIASNSKKLGAISSIAFYNLPLDYLDTYVDNVNKVTIEEIKVAFKKHIDLDNLAVVTVGNVETKGDARTHS